MDRQLDRSCGVASRWRRIRWTCLDARLKVVGESALTVTSGDMGADAAFGWMRAEMCPGIDATGGLLEADGFYLTLEDSLVTVLPGQELHIRGPGVPGSPIDRRLCGRYRRDCRRRRHSVEVARTSAAGSLRNRPRPDMG